jgi:hypothetical protein
MELRNVDWLDEIAAEKRLRKSAEDQKSNLANDREIQYKAKAWAFWGELSDRLETDLDRYNANVPDDYALRRESFLGGTRWLLTSASPPRRSLTLQFSFEERRVSCYQLPGKTEHHFRVEVGRDGTMSLTQASSLQPVPVGDEIEVMLKPFLRGL